MVLSHSFFLPEALAQKSEKEAGSRFDRLAEEATLLNKRGQYDQVISLLEPHKADPKNDSALFYNELGIAYRHQEKLVQSIQAYQKAISVDPQGPGLPVILNNLGHVYYLNKEYPKAIEQYQKALQLAPRFKEAHTNLSLVYYQLERYTDALNEIDAALKLNPQDTPAIQLREEILKKIKPKK